MNRFQKEAVLSMLAIYAICAVASFVIINPFDIDIGVWWHWVKSTLHGYMPGMMVFWGLLSITCIAVAFGIWWEWRCTRRFLGDLEKRGLKK